MLCLNMISYVSIKYQIPIMWLAASINLAINDGALLGVCNGVSGPATGYVWRVGAKLGRGAWQV